tara:strand:+ start:747 stop:848 length:102 start_codon:yes stop_codon:yes gene_type:complete
VGLKATAKLDPSKESTHASGGKFLLVDEEILGN